MRLIFWLVVLVAIGGIAWIRLAPSDPAVWHVDPKVTADQDLAAGVRRRIPGDESRFESLHRIILETPRTEVLAGSPGEGRVTYITRSQWMGFPDYTTVQLDETNLELFARLRFGTTDSGVNKARVESWLQRLQATDAE
ncbi:MAG: DUF1499 domain-containing protein [Salipiger thiooxidans]|uniref:DUF1499 domain-containing protein n=1 Tax=Salipiger TaxID=263377 RepID=UPI00142DBDCE|nr:MULTISPECIES: DUF1499 domain-containing protein [Salipiger]NIY99516.1 DUF1499 domain-containing protein [Salipiger sp. HF18]NVK62355.1 DUF1499 domain-containing protein [Paracoccaceae bacterium]